MKTRFPIWFVFAAILFFSGKMVAADVASQFNMANKLYAEGKFTEAANLYEKMIQAGKTSPTLFFNYGNAEFKSRHLGRAIVAYRQAEQLSPRDADIRANLEFVRNQVQGSTYHESRWKNWIEAFTLNEWTMLAVVAFWLLFGLLAARQIWPALRKTLRSLTRLAAVVTVLACVGCGAATLIHFSEQTAVVVTPDAVIRSGPFSDAQKVFTAHDGAELTVLGQRNDWWQISAGAESIGWVAGQQVKVLSGG